MGIIAHFELNHAGIIAHFELKHASTFRRQVTAL
jgi:hypothetical protein